MEIARALTRKYRIGRDVSVQTGLVRAQSGVGIPGWRYDVVILENWRVHIVEIAAEDRELSRKCNDDVVDDFCLHIKTVGKNPGPP